MPDIQLDLTVPLLPQQAFDVFVEQMDTWWPRQGVFPYSFAPKTTWPRHIRFEAKLDGRYYETFADESEYEIGRITLWQPPTHLAYTWHDPTWADSTSIDLRFAASDEGTRILYQQDGFAGVGVAWLVPYYQIGCGQTLAGYVAHCRALHAAQEQGLRLD